MGKGIGFRFRSLRLALGIHTIGAGAERARMRVETVDGLENGQGTFRSAVDYAEGLGKRLVVVGFFPSPKKMERMREVTGLDPRTFMACHATAASPLHSTHNPTLQSLELFLTAYGARLELA